MWVWPNQRYLIKGLAGKAKWISKGYNTMIIHSSLTIPLPSFSEKMTTRQYCKTKIILHSLMEFCGTWPEFLVPWIPMLQTMTQASSDSNTDQKSVCTPHTPLFLSLIVNITDICTHSIISFPCLSILITTSFLSQFLHLINWPPMWPQLHDISNYFRVFLLFVNHNHHHQPHPA